MPNRPSALVAIALLTLFLVGCGSKETPDSRSDAQPELEGIQSASDAYRAYEQGDCETARRLTEPQKLEDLTFNELRHSMLLVQGFCLELDGDIEGARRIYRSLVIQAPTSFAADDAAERTRVLKLMEEDPEYGQRARDARKRIDPNRPRRTPIDRSPAEFPPLAKAVGVAGYVVVDFAITQRGTTEDPFVVDSKPPYLFDGAALRAVRQWEYMRESFDGQDNRQLIRIVFRPDGSEDLDHEDPTSEAAPQ